MKITVYLGSSFGNDPIYKENIIELGHWLAKQKHQLIYGGSKDGLMGILADTVLADGGEVYGIIPLDFKKREKAHLHLTELTVVADMDERKRLLMDNGELFWLFQVVLELLRKLSKLFLGHALGSIINRVFFLI